MSTYTQILYQIVFSTKHREKTILESREEELYRYIWGVLNDKKCVLYQVGGVSDHIHIVTHLHPSVALADVVKDIKMSTSSFIKENQLFPHFDGWQNGYGAFTYNIEAKENLINYVKRQKAHHQRQSLNFRKEYKELLEEHHIEYDEKYLL